MLESAQAELAELRRLALSPTPANFQHIQARLESLAAALSRALADPEPLLRDPVPIRTLLQSLPSELQRLHSLLQAPVSFFRGLDALAAAHFGAYGRSGDLQSLQPKPTSRTIVHL